MAIMMMSWWKWLSRDIFKGGGVASIKTANMLMSRWKWLTCDIFRGPDVDRDGYHDDELMNWISRDIFWQGGMASIKTAIMMMSRWKWNSHDIFQRSRSGVNQKENHDNKMMKIGSSFIIVGGLTLIGIGMAIMMMSRWKWNSRDIFR